MKTDAPVAPLPPGFEPHGLAGQSNSDCSHCKIKVSNANGYLCHIHLESFFNCDPSLLYSIFTNPDNTKIFRDIKEVAARRVLDDSVPGLKIVEVEQIGEAKILWLTQRFRTLLRVTEDARDPSRLMTSFDLIRSDILSRFNGSWTLTPAKGTLDVERRPGTYAVLEQDLLPAGVPAFFKHLPVVGNALRGISIRAVKRMVEDIERVIVANENGVNLLSSSDTRLKADGPSAHAVALDDDSDEDEERRDS